jgi:hypothetical protein
MAMATGTTTKMTATMINDYETRLLMMTLAMMTITTTMTTMTTIMTTTKTTMATMDNLAIIFFLISL